MIGVGNEHRVARAERDAGDLPRIRTGGGDVDGRAVRRCGHARERERAVAIGLQAREVSEPAVPFLRIAPVAPVAQQQMSRRSHA